MRLSRLNENGIARFDDFRDSAWMPVEELREVLENEACSEKVDPEVEVESRQFTNRFEVGAYLHSIFEGVHLPTLDSDVGVWAWLAAFYFDQLCPPGVKPGDRARWILAIDDFRKYYRHLLFGPYQIFKGHRDRPQRAMVLLANTPDTPGEIAEQFTARQEYVTNPSILEVATTLYFNPESGSTIRGAAGSGPGSARRLNAVLNQLDLTWDLHSLSPEQLMDLLPTEFDRFRP